MGCTQGKNVQAAGGGGATTMTAPAMPLADKSGVALDHFVEENINIEIEEDPILNTKRSSKKSTHSNESGTERSRSVLFLRKKSVSEPSETQKFLRESKFFMHLSNSQLRAAENHLELRELEEGTKFVEANTSSDNVYIVMSGSVGMVLAANGKERLVGPHETIGEAGFYYNIRHTFDAIAKEPSTLLVLTRKTYNAQRKKDWMSILNGYMEMAARQLVIQRLRHLDFVSRLNEDQLIELGHLIQVQTVTRGENIFKEGENGDTFFLLVHGELVVTLNSSKGLEMIEIKRLKAGDSFGEISLLEKSKRTATVTAMEDSTLFTLSKSKFDEFLSIAPEIHEKMVASIKERSAVNLLTKKIPFFEFLGPNKLHLLSAMAMPTYYARGAKILSQGNRHPAMFFIIMHGSVNVIIDGEKKKELTIGSYFGELSILSNRAHSATITAGDNGARCLTITKSEFTTIFHDEPAIFAEIQIKVLGRNAELAHILHHPLGRKLFLKHCEKEYAQENISFFLEAEKLELMGTQQVRRDVLEVLGHNVEDVISKREKELELHCTTVYKRFIDPQGPEPINIKAEQRKDITEKIEAKEYSYEIFSDAKNAIYKLLERDNFSRFQNSKSYQHLLDELGGGYADAGKRKSVSESLKSRTSKVATIDRSTIQRNVREQIVEAS